ncbi:hypothetical protein LTR66_010424 [Elasticomyces elasticus]|nr:hypothetical protein LTR66_010424 [Elasticomyces elasticus]
MFAPPPPRALTVEQIAAAKARLAERNALSPKPSSLPSRSTSLNSSIGSRDSGGGSKTKKRSLFSKDRKSVRQAPINSTVEARNTPLPASPLPLPPPPPPPNGHGPASPSPANSPRQTSLANVDSKQNSPRVLDNVASTSPTPVHNDALPSPPPFAESPRPAPTPPFKVSPRPPSELFLPAFNFEAHATTQPNTSFSDSSLTAALADLSASEPLESLQTTPPRADAPERSLTAPATLSHGENTGHKRRKTSSPPANSHGPDVRTRSERTVLSSGVRGARIVLDDERASSVFASGVDISANIDTPERPKSGEKSPAARKSPLNQGQRSLWRRRRKGETMSMLIEAGFFPVRELIYANTQDGSMHLDIAETTDRDLPPTPGSISSTPVEMYHRQPPPRSPPRAVRARKLGTSKGMRSPLSQLPAGDDDAGAGPQSTTAGQTQLTSIQEDETTSEAARVKPTMIRLRSGSVLTVTPPEMTAWKRSVYVQGPIRLQPLMTPRRKGSIASLEPFYSTAALDMIYQKALEIPRRRSDNAVMDEICDFFDDFGIGDDLFDGDKFSLVDEPAVPMYVGEVERVFEDYAERFPAPPTFRYWAAAGDEAEFIDDNEPRKASAQDEDIGPLEEKPELEVPEPLFSPRILPGLPLPATDGEVVEEERMGQEDVSNLETPGAKTSSSASSVPTGELPTTPTDVDPRPTTTAAAPTSPLGALIAAAAEKYIDPSPPPNPPDPTALPEEAEDLPPSTHASRTPSIGSLGSNLELYTTNSSTEEQEKQQQQQQSSFEWDNETSSSSRQQKLSPGLQQQQQRQNKGGTVYKMRRFVRAAGAIL